MDPDAPGDARRLGDPTLDVNSLDEYDRERFLQLDGTEPKVWGISSGPFLLLYGNEEDIARSDHARFTYNWDKEHPDGCDRRERWKTELNYLTFIRHWQLTRLLRTLNGFVTGNLDLSGRHAPRWSEYIQQLHELTLDFSALNPVNAEISNHDDAIKTKKVYEFREKWKIPVFSLEYVLEGIRENMAEFVQAKGVGKIQELCLTDLPSELLDCIFSHCDLSDARRLSLACRNFHSISQRYINNTRKFAVHLPDKVYMDYEHYSTNEEHGRTRLRTLIGSLHKEFINYANLILERPDLSSAAQSLSFSSTVVDTALRLEWPSEFISEVQSTLSSIGSKFTRVLGACSNLTALSIHSQTLTMSSLEAICDLVHLERLQLNDCPIPDDVVAILEQGTHSLTSSRASNLNLRMFSAREISDTHTWSTWYILCIFPHVRNLFAGGFYDMSNLQHDALELPPLSVLLRFKFFHSVEHLALNCLTSQALMHLGQYLVLTAAQPPAANPVGALKLTHLRILTREPATLDIWIALVRGIELGARKTLEVLVISGLGRDAVRDASLFRWIARRLPDLKALSIDLHAGEDKSSFGVRWPQPPSVYAPALSEFTSLKYLGLNFHMMEDYSPCSIEDFETLADLEQKREQKIREREQVGEVEIDDNWDWPWMKGQEKEVNPFSFRPRSWISPYGGKVRDGTAKQYGLFDDQHLDVTNFVVHRPTLEMVSLVSRSTIIDRGVFFILPVKDPQYQEDCIPLHLPEENRYHVDSDNLEGEERDVEVDFHHSPACEHPSKDCFLTTKTIFWRAQVRPVYVSRSGGYKMFSAYSVWDLCRGAWGDVHRRWNPPLDQEAWPYLPQLNDD
ncbi:hypothetical protein FA15DRAFT_706815 [Coprinopsis marcescibilis]|uniref:F-box domain-containing protein n=1 Tax=Coprinopsis marcescibilis TaxID=230819 RepID=A0A5C3KPA3_COPMA|nr:hypothetical protein FA15DRAFT_706815 [Coprinopsis marcescibilis]